MPPDWAASMEVLQSRVVKGKDPCGGVGNETLQASQEVDGR